MSNSIISKNDIFNERSVSRYLKTNDLQSRSFYLKGSLNTQGTRTWELVKTDYPMSKAISKFFSSKIYGDVFISGGEFLQLASSSLNSIKQNDPVSGNVFFKYFCRNKITDLNPGKTAQLKSKLKSAIGKSLKIGKGLALSDQAVSLHKDYWQESLSASHSYGDDLNALYQAWSLDSTTSLNFDDWCIEKNHIQPNQKTQVQYFNEGQRKQYQVDFREGLLKREGEPIHTIHYQSINDVRPGLGIFVISSDGKMYIGPHEHKVIHHSSYLSGAAIIGAGEIRTDENGKLLEITSKSGHYKPEKAQLLSSLQYLRAQGVPLRGVKVVEVGEEGNRIYNDAAVYLETEGETRVDGLNDISFIYSPKTRAVSGLVINEPSYSKPEKQTLVREMIAFTKLDPEKNIEVIESMGSNVSLKYRLSDYLEEGDAPAKPIGFEGGNIETRSDGNNDVIINRPAFDDGEENQTWLRQLLGTLFRTGVINERSDLVIENLKAPPQNIYQHLQS